MHELYLIMVYLFVILCMLFSVWEFFFCCDLWTLICLFWFNPPFGCIWTMHPPPYQHLYVKVLYTLLDSFTCLSVTIRLELVHGWIFGWWETNLFILIYTSLHPCCIMYEIVDYVDLYCYSIYFDSWGFIDICQMFMFLSLPPCKTRVHMLTLWLVLWIPSFISKWLNLKHLSIIIFKMFLQIKIFF